MTSHNQLLLLWLLLISLLLHKLRWLLIFILHEERLVVVDDTRLFQQLRQVYLDSRPLLLRTRFNL